MKTAARLFDQRMVKRSLFLLVAALVIACGGSPADGGADAPVALQAPRQTQPASEADVSEMLEPLTDAAIQARQEAEDSGVVPATLRTTRAEQLQAADLGATVLPAEGFSDPQVRDTYAKAREVASRIDQMYCYCRCRENEQFRHKSLLTCFQSDHAAACGVCLDEAKQAWRDFKDGYPVSVTQRTADLQFNDGASPSAPVAAHAH